MNKLDNIKSLLSEWLVGTIFASINFAVGFTIRLERTETSDKKPNVLNLDIRSTARFGNEGEWKHFIDSLPFKTRRGEIDEPALAYRLMLLLGAMISEVELKGDGSISISTTDGETFTVLGIEDVWEESWVLTEPRDVAGEQARSIICSSEGSVFVT